MKNVLYSTFRISFLCLALGFAGCGGGGGGDDSPSSGNNNTLAPASAAGRQIQISESGRPDRTIQFASGSNSFTEPGSSDPSSTGTYSYNASGNTATLVLTTGSGVITMTLTFASETSGNFTYTSTTGASGQGTFQGFTVVTGGNPDPGGTGGDPGSGNGGGNDAGLNGKMMTLTRSTGQTHTYTFTGDHFRDSDPPEEGTGTYTYAQTGSQANLSLSYTGSSTLAGDRHDIQLNFSSSTGGTYASTYYRNDGTVLPQNGTFQFLQ